MAELHKTSHFCTIFLRAEERTETDERSAAGQPHGAYQALLNPDVHRPPAHVDRRVCEFDADESDRPAALRALCRPWLQNVRFGENFYPLLAPRADGRKRSERRKGLLQLLHDEDSTWFVWIPMIPTTVSAESRANLAMRPSRYELSHIPGGRQSYKQQLSR